MAYAAPVFLQAQSAITTPDQINPVGVLVVSSKLLGTYFHCVWCCSALFIYEGYLSEIQTGKFSITSLPVHLTVSPAAERLRYILGDDEEAMPTPTLFTEMDTLQLEGDELEWKESAR